MIKDLNNFINASHRDQIFEIDSKSTLTYLSVKAEKEEQFFYGYIVNDDNRLSHLFWASYNILMFDIINKTNSYKISFMIFICINHHIFAIVFAYALFFNERILTYT